MKSIELILVVLLLTGCASSGGGSEGTPKPDTTRAQAIARIHTELAESYYERAQYGVALQEIGVALQVDTNFAPAYNVRALIRMALREDDKAEEDFRHSLDLDSSNSETHNNYGWFLCQRGQTKESIQQFLDALKNPLYATPEMAYVNLGMCSKKAGLIERGGKQSAARPDPASGYAGGIIRLGELEFRKAVTMRVQNPISCASLQVSPELNAEQLWLARAH